MTAPPAVEAARLRLRVLYAGASAPTRVRPTFVVIGAEKSGTTSLHRYLDDHPAVLCATPKEVHYFDINLFQRPVWYPMHFPFRSRARSSARAEAP